MEQEYIDSFNSWAAVNVFQLGQNCFPATYGSPQMLTHTQFLE